MMRSAFLVAASLVYLVHGQSSMAQARSPMAEIPGGLYRLPFQSPGFRESIMVRAFRLDRRPVSIRSFLAFVRKNPRYSKSRIKPRFADALYLSSWNGDFQPPAHRGKEPVTGISWFAAKAYCDAEGKRLPTTAEWEVAAMAIPEGLDSAAYATAILDWYARPAIPGGEQEKGSVNAFGVRDLHGRIWEWTSDFNAVGPGKPGSTDGKDAWSFCGGGGAGGATADGVDYATFMRFSFRSSLKPDFSLRTLGFRCAEGG